MDPVEKFQPLRELPRPDRLTPFLLAATGLILAGCLFFLGRYWWDQRSIGNDETPALEDAPTD